METPIRVTRTFSRAILFTVVVLCSIALAKSGWAQQAPPESLEWKPSREVVTDKGNIVHLFLAPAAEARYRAERAALGFAPTATNLAYFGGPVMRNPVNFLIFWQPPGRQPFPAGFQAGVEAYFQNLSGTPFYNIVTQYNDKTGTPVPDTTSLGAPSFTDTTTDPTTASGFSGCDGSIGPVGVTPTCPLTDGDIQAEVAVAQAANPQWGPPTLNTEYFVFTSPDAYECNTTSAPYNCFSTSSPVNPVFNETGAFCAYHGALVSSTTPYAYLPFAASGNCYPSAAIQALGFPNTLAVDLVLSATSHEMFESNTDPLPGMSTRAWQGTGGISDEIGDKCAFNYGYVAPDGNNVVLSGNRFQIQQEFSNDVTLCTKRYGPAPVTGSPGPVAFGEVQAGASAQQGILIQNNGGGDLNILNIRLGTASSFYTLTNSQPTAATLHSSESLTANVQFAPATGSLFGNPADTLIVDTDQTPASGSTTFTNISGTIGVPPSAVCKNATVSTDPNLCTTAVASVNNGSSDPDGEGITFIQSPGGPYTLGMTPVTLTVTDNGPDHESASCSALVIVQDHQAPTITCPAATTVQCTSSSGTMVSLNPTVFDNCPGVTASCMPASGSSFGFGTTPVTCKAIDASGNMSSCMTSVTVTDVPPVIASVTASPAVLSPPNKKLVPVTILVKDSDTCDPSPSCSITSVTANQKIPASDIKITGPLTVMLANAGTGGHPLTYIVTVTCTDAHGGSTSAQTSVTSN